MWSCLVIKVQSVAFFFGEFCWNHRTHCVVLHLRTRTAMTCFCSVSILFSRQFCREGINCYGGVSPSIGTILNITTIPISVHQLHCVWNTGSYAAHEKWVYTDHPLSLWPGNKGPEGCRLCLLVRAEVRSFSVAKAFFPCSISWWSALQEVTRL